MDSKAIKDNPEFLDCPAIWVRKESKDILEEMAPKERSDHLGLQAEANSAMARLDPLDCQVDPASLDL